jgi:hypothetical protein
VSSAGDSSFRGKRKLATKGVIARHRESQAPYHRAIATRKRLTYARNSNAKAALRSNAGETATAKSALGLAAQKCEICKQNRQIYENFIRQRRGLIVS